MTSDFIILVEKMRAAQVAYFRNRNGVTLSEAKDLEAKVDAAIRAWRKESAEKQKGLFDATP